LHTKPPRLFAPFHPKELTDPSWLIWNAGVIQNCAYYSGFEKRRVPLSKVSLEGEEKRRILHFEVGVGELHFFGLPEFLDLLFRFCLNLIRLPTYFHPYKIVFCQMIFKKRGVRKQKDLGKCPFRAHCTDEECKGPMEQDDHMLSPLLSECPLTPPSCTALERTHPDLPF
jgi:hypothetical protein